MLRNPHTYIKKKKLNMVARNNSIQEAVVFLIY